MTVDTRALRNSFGNFVTGVTLVTTVGSDGKPIAMTANSFSSVSLDPPLVLWCIDKGSDRLGIYQQAQHFAINVLAANHQELSGRFAKKGQPYMDGVDYAVWETGCPVIPDAVAIFECDKLASHDAGDHIIYIGYVRRFQTPETAGKPLVFHRGAYCALA
ncbi:MAG: hypothetical protein Dbin4_01546 [Alphaproteobacteria bacterium]|nr:hypothetical protein [Alphaproteobacteria bacterium]